MPHPYQKKALKFLLERRSAGLFLDPGLGKTSITLAAIKVLKAQKLHKGTIIVAPRRPALMVWRQEAHRWLDFHGLKVGLVHGANREAVWEKSLDIYIVTYEGLAWLIKTGRLKKSFRAKKIDGIVYDELSKVKNTQTARFRGLRPLLGFFERRWGLTGSPAANGLLDLFGECYALDLGATLGQYITQYRFQYFDAYGDQMHPGYTPKPGAEEAIFARVANLALRIDAADHLKLPRLIVNEVRMQLPDKVREMYDELEDEFMVEWAGATFAAANSAALSQKCEQIANGALYEDRVDPETGIPRSGKRKYHVLHDEKIEALADLFDELNGQQLFVMYWFGHDRERLLEYFGKDLPVLGGNTSDKKAAEYEEAWNNGWIPMLLGQPASVGHGLNLQRSSANQIAAFSLPWSYELYDQFIRRLLRQGNKSGNVTLHQFIVDDTVDRLKSLTLRRKGGQQDRLHDALKAYRPNRAYTGLLAGVS